MISAPGHDRPKRARAYLLTDQAVTETAARYANSRPSLDSESQHAIPAANGLRDSAAGNIQPPEVRRSAGDRSGPSSADEALWLALCLAPDDRTDVGELLRLTADYPRRVNPGQPVMRSRSG